MEIADEATSALLGWPEVTGIRENSTIPSVLTGKLARLTVPMHPFPNPAVLAEFRAAVPQRGGRVAG